MSDDRPREEGLESHRADAAPNTNVERPDWLVGPDEGAASEVERNAHAGPGGAPQLARPGLPLNESEPARKKPAKAVAWTAAASSVPTIRRREDEEPRSSQGQRTRPEGAPGQPWSAPTTPPGNDAPSYDDPDESLDQEGLAGGEFPMDDVAGAAAGAAASRPRPAAKVYKEPVWVVALDALRTNRVIQAVIVLAAVAFVVWKMWPSEVPTLAISKIHANPASFDGRTVELHGRVGEVFQLGGGYAFYLHQGRDTIVVFTRSRVPTPREKIAVLGSVSTGYLDGVARPALFEETAR